MEENKEIIDIDVIEETEIKEASSEVSIYSDEEIDSFCIKLKEELRNNDFHNNNASLELAKIIAENSKEYLDNETYLWTMYAYALKYEEEQNINAMRYCFIRMRSVIDAMQGKRKKQKALTFVDSDLPESVIALVIENTVFMEEESKRMKNQFLKMEMVMMVIFAFVIKFILKYSWLMTALLCVLLFMLNYKFSYTSLMQRYHKEQTNACKDFSKDEEIKSFDLPVYNS